jgi:hypothetical protein
LISYKFPPYSESFTYPAVENNIVSISERFNTTERILGIKLIDESGTGLQSAILDGGKFNKYVVFQINSTERDQDLKFKIQMFNADKDMIENGALRNGSWSVFVVLILVAINYVF